MARSETSFTKSQPGLRQGLGETLTRGWGRVGITRYRCRWRFGCCSGQGSGCRRNWSRIGFRLERANLEDDRRRYGYGNSENEYPGQDRQRDAILFFTILVAIPLELVLSR